MKSIILIDEQHNDYELGRVDWEENEWRDQL
jgi:hypothetical protein